MSPVAFHKSIDVLVELTVRELAELFAALAGDEQAQFFQEVGVIMSNWGSPRCVMQARYIADAIDKPFHERAQWLIQELAGHLEEARRG